MTLLIDHYLPYFHARKRHEIDVRAPVEQVYAADRTLDLSGSPTARWLFRLRGRPQSMLRLERLLQMMRSVYNGSNVVGSSSGRLAAGYGRRRCAQSSTMQKDEMLDVFAVSGAWAELPGKIQQKYGNLLDRVGYYLPFVSGRMRLAGALL